MAFDGSAAKGVRDTMNGYDIDGVITIGLLPQKNDIIISGRSTDELPETKKLMEMLHLDNELFLNPIPFEQKTREKSGYFKVGMLTVFKNRNIHIDKYFEDDPVQADIIEKHCDWVSVVRIIHNLTEKENRRNYIE